MAKLKEKKPKKSKKKNSKKEEFEIKELKEEKENGQEEKELKPNFFDEIKFQEQLEDIRINPVLEKVIGQQERPIFVGGIPQRFNPEIGGFGNGKEDFKYVSSSNQAEGPKYLDSSSHIKETATRADFSKIGRENERFQFKEMGEIRMHKQEQSPFTPERMGFAERFNPDMDRKKDISNKEEKEYKPYLPRSK